MDQHTLLKTQCCIVGGGPAGVMLGFLLARAGVDTIVLEKHRDFFRDFRGDTIHPSTLELMAELGLLDEFLTLPHQKLYRAGFRINGNDVVAMDFSGVRAQCRFVAMMPQWDFLNFLASQAKQYPGFKLLLETEAVELRGRQGHYSGVLANTPTGLIQIQAGLTIGADGRSSTVRRCAGLSVTDYGAPMDVLWLRIPKQGDHGEHSFGFVGEGKMLILIDREQYWQCGYIIPKGGIAHEKQLGLTAFKKNIVQLAPFTRVGLETITTWEAVKLLTVKVDRLKQWYQKGLLCIGDSAHAMSPIGGVGVNLAIQDAVAAANILAAPLLENSVVLDHLRAVQKRRERPARLTQKGQLFLQRHFIGKVVAGKSPRFANWMAKLLSFRPLGKRIQRFQGRITGLGILPEHIQTPDIGKNQSAVD